MVGHYPLEPPHIVEFLLTASRVFVIPRRRTSPARTGITNTLGKGEPRPLYPPFAIPLSGKERSAR
jgi:hypothetical protein